MRRYMLRYKGMFVTMVFMSAFSLSGLKFMKTLLGLAFFLSVFFSQPSFAFDSHPIYMMSSVALSAPRFEMPDEKIKRRLKETNNKLAKIEEESTQLTVAIENKIKALNELKSKSAEQISTEKKQAEDFAKAEATAKKVAKIAKLKNEIESQTKRNIEYRKILDNSKKETKQKEKRLQDFRIENQKIGIRRSTGINIKESTNANGGKEYFYNGKEIQANADGSYVIEKVASVPVRLEYSGSSNCAISRCSHFVTKNYNKTSKIIIKSNGTWDYNISMPKELAADLPDLVYTAYRFTDGQAETKKRTFYGATLNGFLLTGENELSLRLKYRLTPTERNVEWLSDLKTEIEIDRQVAMNSENLQMQNQMAVWEKQSELMELESPINSGFSKPLEIGLIDLDLTPSEIEQKRQNKIKKQAAEQAEIKKQAIEQAELELASLQEKKIEKANALENVKTEAGTIEKELMKLDPFSSATILPVAASAASAAVADVTMDIIPTQLGEIPPAVMEGMTSAAMEVAEAKQAAEAEEVLAKINSSGKLIFKKGYVKGSDGKLYKGMSPKNKENLSKSLKGEIGVSTHLGSLVVTLPGESPVAIGLDVLFKEPEDKQLEVIEKMVSKGIKADRMAASMSPTAVEKLAFLPEITGTAVSESTSTIGMINDMGITVSELNIEPQDLQIDLVELSNVLDTQDLKEALQQAKDQISEGLEMAQTEFKEAEARAEHEQNQSDAEAGAHGGEAEGGFRQRAYF